MNGKIKHINDLWRKTEDKKVTYYEFDAIKHLPHTEVMRCHFIPRAKTISIVQADGSIKTAYVYGEKTWSYDKKAIEKHKANAEQQRIEARMRNILMNKIKSVCNKMELADLELFVNDICR